MRLLGNLMFVVGLMHTIAQMLPEISGNINVSNDNFSTDHLLFFEQNERIMAAKENKFRDDFFLGVSTSSYQIEGGWNVSDKSESNWDFMIHNWPTTINDGSNADIAANSYYMYKTDIDLVKQIGANAYRMSLSWSRILPTGFTNHISKDGIRYYNNVIDTLLDNGIEPHVTLFHWDLPQKLQELGGWTNPLIVNWFVDYARVVFTEFGDRVKHWSTINEPSMHCAYNWDNKYVPAAHQSGIADYLCGHYSLLAHSNAYRMYNNEFRSVQNGRVGIVLNLQWGIEQDSGDDKAGAEQWFQWFNNWFLHPLFTDKGDYPDIMKKRIAEYSDIQGFSKSRLPEFSANEIELIKYSSDFLGINFYAAVSIAKWDKYDVKNGEVSFYGDMGMREAEGVLQSRSIDAKCTPWAFVLMMQRVNDEFNIPMFFITENGYWDAGQLVDIGRAKYYHEHLTEVLKLIAQGIDIRGYFAWSLFDNFEWTLGYTRHYGLFSIDMTDPNRTRIPKISTKIITEIYKTKTVSHFLWYSNKTEYDFNIGD